VFHRTRGPVDLDDYTNWWSWVPGAQWRHPEGPGSTLEAASAIRSPTSPKTTPRPMPPGPPRSSRPRLNGSSRRAAGSTPPPTRGATSSHRRAASWRTPGRASSRGRTCCSTGSSGRRRSGRSERMATASTTSPATSGNGRPTSRVARTCARRTTATATVRQPARRRRSRPRWATWASAASSVPRTSRPAMPVVKGSLHRRARPAYGSCSRPRPPGRHRAG
jgi:hypothetical protein